MKLRSLLILLLLSVSSAFAGVPTVTVSFTCSGANFVGANGATLQLHTSYAPAGYNGLCNIPFNLPAITAGNSYTLVLDVSGGSPNYPTADYINLLLPCNGAIYSLPLMHHFRAAGARAEEVK